MNKAIFITVRTGSTRLPKKALIELNNGLATIEYLIRRVKHSLNTDGIILCTTTESADDILVEIADRNGISHFRGSKDDKLNRWLNAAEKFNVKSIVTADGDDLFCEPELIDLAFNQLEKGKADLIQSSGIICGAFTYGIRVEALKKVCEIKDSEDTEMMWVYFTETGLFNVEELQNVPKQYFRNDIRMTLDYQEDLDFFLKLLNLFDNSTEYFPLDKIVKIIDKNPKLKGINIFRQKEFLINQATRTNLRMKVNLL